MAEATPEEVMAVTASRLLADHRVVFAGVGMPLLASVLARRRQAPNLTVVLEGGIIGAEMLPGHLPISTNEMRAAFGSHMLTDVTDVFLFAQRGFFDYGFLGAAQIDRYGNINTSIIGDRDHPKVRLPGTGGANDIVSLCNETIVVTTHERRRFVERVDFVTSPGYLSGGDSRRAAGLSFGRVSAVITDLALLDFETEDHRMRLRCLQEGVSVGDVVEATEFELAVADDLDVVPGPLPEELAIYRTLRDGPAPAAHEGPEADGVLAASPGGREP